jgi:hypothetical protein
MTSPTTPVATSGSTVDRGPARPSLMTTSSIAFFGNFAWLGWLWLVLLLLLPVVLTIITLAGGELSASLWTSGAAGWQRWVLFASGVVTATTLLRIFVTHGVTRRRAAHSGMLAMVALVVACQIVVVLGFLIEGWFFDHNGWPDPGFDSSWLFRSGSVPRLVTEHMALLSVHYLSGWLVGAGFVRFGTAGGIALIAPCLIPIAICELLVSRDSGRMNIEALPDVIEDPHVGVVVAGCAAVLLATAYLASRVTRALPVR